MSARILIVDDDPALLEALPDAIALRMNGITIDTCETAPGALDKIQQTDYDVNVTDTAEAVISASITDAIARSRPALTITSLDPTKVESSGENDHTVAAAGAAAL